MIRKLIFRAVDNKTRRGLLGHHESIDQRGVQDMVNSPKQLRMHIL